MRILLMSGVLVTLGAVPAAAQTSNPIQTIDLPPSVSATSDPFARVDDAGEAATTADETGPADETALASETDTGETPPAVSPALAAGAAAVGNTGSAVAADAPSNETETAVGRVDAIMEMLLGPSEEEQRAVAAKIYAEQAERHRLEMQRAETLNREARQAVEAENARRLAEYRAEVERINSEHAEREQARLADWRARVVACEAGDRAACGQ